MSLYSWPHPQVALKEVADNGMKQYVKSRNTPSPESVTRAKKLTASLVTVQYHPLFGMVHYFLYYNKSLMIFPPFYSLQLVAHPMRLKVFSCWTHWVLTIHCFWRCFTYLTIIIWSWYPTAICKQGCHNNECPNSLCQCTLSVMLTIRAYTVSSVSLGTIVWHHVATSIEWLPCNGIQCSCVPAHWIKQVSYSV